LLARGALTLVARGGRAAQLLQHPSEPIARALELSEVR